MPYSWAIPAAQKLGFSGEERFGSIISFGIAFGGVLWRVEPAEWQGQRAFGHKCTRGQQSGPAA